MASVPYQLVMHAGPTPDKTFTLSKTELYIGRDISNDIVINDAEVSRKHVRMILQAGQYVLEDLGSTNGTFVNNQRATGPVILAPGHMIQMGENVTLLFDQVQMDPDATVAVSKEQTDELERTPVTPPAPMPASTAVEPPVLDDSPPMRSPQPAVPTPGPAETFTGGPAPAPPAAEPAEAEKSRRTWIIAGCGCLFLVVCVLVPAVAAWYIDSQALWCEVAPFLPGC